MPKAIEDFSGIGLVARTAPSFDARRAEYARQFAAMSVYPNLQDAVDNAARKLLKNKDTYDAVQRLTGVPWFVVGCINWREASGNLKGVLHNGELIVGTNLKTKLVPKGQGPFATFEAAAVDAIRDMGMDKVKFDSPERCAYWFEAFNGWGYFYHGVPSAYLWAFSNIYEGGKYVADGVWSSSATDAQIGVMPLMQRLMHYDAKIGVVLGLAKPPVVPIQEPQVPPAPTNVEDRPTSAIPAPQPPAWWRPILDAIAAFLKGLLPR